VPGVVFLEDPVIQFLLRRRGHSRLAQASHIGQLPTTRKVDGAATINADHGLVIGKVTPHIIIIIRINIYAGGPRRVPPAPSETPREGLDILVATLRSLWFPARLRLPCSGGGRPTTPDSLSKETSAEEKITCQVWEGLPPATHVSVSPDRGEEPVPTGEHPARDATRICRHCRYSGIRKGPTVLSAFGPGPSDGMWHTVKPSTTWGAHMAPKS
jgi:hypothetical protein